MISDPDPRTTRGLDFYLPDLGVFIEVKQFHSNRIADQMARVENVIVIQGMHAAHVFAGLVVKLDITQASEA